MPRRMTPVATATATWSIVVAGSSGPRMATVARQVALAMPTVRQLGTDSMR